MSLLTVFFINNWKAVAALSSEIALLTVVYKAAEIRSYAWYVKELLLDNLHKAQIVLMKARTAVIMTYNVAVALLTGNVTRAAAALRLMRIAAISNPYTALLAVVLALSTAVYSAAAAWRNHSQAIHENLQETKNLRAQQQLQNELNKNVSESIAEQKTRVEQLTRIIRSNAYSVDERRKAIKTLQSIVPEYHASINKEGKLYDENSNAIKQYIQNLNDAALAEAIYAKKVEINKKKLELAFKADRIKGSLRAVQAYRDSQPQTETVEMEDENGNTLTFQGRTKSAVESDRQQKIHEQRLKDTQSEQKTLEAEEKYVDGLVEKNKKVKKLLDNRITSTTANDPNTPSVSNTTYESDEDKKKRKAAADKAEDERKKKLKEQADAARASYNEQIAEEMLAYRQGITTYSDYLEKKHNITQNYYERLKAIYGEDSVEYRKQLLNKEKDEDEYTRRQNKMSEQGFLMQKYMRDLNLQKQFNDQNNREMFQNEDALNEALFKSDRQYMLDKASLYKEGSKEWEEAMTEIHIMEEEHRMQLEQEWMTRLSKYRQDMGKLDYDRLQEIEIAGVQSFYGALVEQGKMTQEEVDAIIAHIKMKYAELKGNQTADNDVQTKASSALDTAKKNAGVKFVDAGDNAATAVYSIVNAIQNQQAINEQLKALYGEDYENNKEYQEAKRQLNVETMQNIVAGAQAAYNTINSFMTAASAYFSAAQEAETAQVKAKYEKQIAAAGNNQKKVKKLQEKQAKEEAAIKSKYNKRAVNIQIAQAIAQTAIGAINAYSSAAAIPIVGTVLAPIAAAAALAAGMIQVAAIKKQAQAQEAGYYSGGYTGGNQYRKEAGVVHQGEFVANHQAVQNPNVRPMLDFIDKAQRNNTVGSLTAEDISRQLGQGGNTVVTPIVNVNNDNEELKEELSRSREVNQQLLAVIEEKGIKVDFPMDSFDRSYKHFQKLNNR